MARANAYRLFARLFREGLTGDTRALVERIPGFADALPAGHQENEEAAAFQDLFGFTVYPYASAFLTAQGRLGGRYTQEALVWRRACSLPDRPGEAEDHIASELEILAHLSALASGDAKNPHVTEQRTADFLDGMVLPWLPAFCWAVVHYDLPFYVTLARRTLALVLTHRIDLEGPVPINMSDPPVAPDPPDLASAALSDIRAHLLQPLTAGFWLSRADIRNIGRENDIPSGFGSRRQMLGGLIQSAATFDRVAPVLHGIDHLAARAQGFFKDLGKQYPPLDPAFSGPRTTIERTRRLLGDMQAKA